MRDLCASIEKVYLVEVSPAVVTQLNMVANFAGDAQVLSVQAPFYCDCGNENEVTHDLRSGEVTLPKVQCSQCGSEMVFDDDPDAYFMFPLQSAKAKPVDPNIDVFLKHLSEFQEESSLGSSPGLSRPSSRPPSSPGEFASVSTTGGGSGGGSRVSELPVPSLAPSPSSPGIAIPASQYTADIGGSSRGSGAWTNARSVLIGLSVPVVLAVLLVLFWPRGGSGAGLPGDAKGEYQEHISAQRYGEAALLIRRLKRQKKIEDQVARTLADEIKAAALGPYSEHLDNERFADAARLVTKAARERVIPPKDSTRLHKEVMERAIARHRELLASEQFSASEALAEGLAARDVLPTALRRSFQNDVALDRQHESARLSRQANEALEAGEFETALGAAKKVARLGPLDADMTYLMAECYRRIDKVDEAAVHFANFIGMVENVDPPHESLDSALYWRAKYLASAGRDSEAKALFKRVTDMPNSSYRDNAARELRR